MRNRRRLLVTSALAVSAWSVIAAGEPPTGRVDGTAPADDRATAVRGWAFDGDASPVYVHVYADGSLVGAGTTGVARPDVVAAHPIVGPEAGFSVTLDPGTRWRRELCVWALDDGAAGSIRLGCVAPPRSHEPIGHLDRVDDRRADLVVWGWAADGDDLADGPPVHVYVDGVLAGAGGTGVDRPDVASVFPAVGGRTGYGVVVEHPGPGRHEICAWAVDVAGDQSRRLGCRWTGIPDDLFTGTRVVAHYGSGVTPLLGVAGEGSPQQAAARVAAVAAEWSVLGTPTVPAFDYIAAVATSWPGPDGDYSNPGDPAQIREYLAAIRGVGGLLVLDIQPGQTDFLTQVRPFEALLAEPDVGLALDPEWRMPPGVVPGTRIGSVDAAEIDEVSEWLAALVREHELPQKVFMVHQFTESMIRDRDRLTHHPELAMVVQLDGFGGRAAKISKYEQLRAAPPWHSGFKLFLDEDIALMAPAEVDAALEPDPVFVSYQ